MCKLCNYHGKSLGQHVSQIHKDITLREYKIRYGELLSDNSFDRYSKANVERENWIVKAKAKGEDLTEAFRKMGENLSKSIMSDPNERKRRSDLVKGLHESIRNNPEAIKKMSDSAKKTSARPEIQAQRAANLKRWRDENPEDFKAKCIDKLVASTTKNPTWFSKPEKMLFAFVSKLHGFSFRFNQCVKSDLFDCKSKRKQVDMADKSKQIYIEYDGPFHFPFKKGGDPAKYADVVKRDLLFEQYIANNKYTLIRISLDQFHDSRKNPHFKQECLDTLVEILNNNVAGIYKIGDKYGEYK